MQNLQNLMIDPHDFRSISRVVSHALRHKPWLYELELDRDGWVPVAELLDVLVTQKREWKNLCEADLVAMIEVSEKKRHELKDGRIRALYGHSVSGRISMQAAEPPLVLFHGTSPQSVEAIKKNGLLPMSRQYVHLSVDRATAEQVGLRKAVDPVVLEIRARQAAQEGLCFYRGNDLVWLADEVPARFVLVPAL